MADIRGHMETLKYSATRFYDASNALVVAGYAERAYIGREKAWIITTDGLEFLRRNEVL